MNTNHDDLKNQLKFLGFEHVEKLLTEIGIKKSKHNRTDMNLLMYFLRPIMMRHSQGQKYRGTSTTLMSLPQKVNHFSRIDVRTLTLLFESCRSLFVSFCHNVFRRKEKNLFNFRHKREQSSENLKEKLKIGISSFGRKIYIKYRSIF